MNGVRGNLKAPPDHSWPQAGARPRILSILLGIFILWELFYLPAANFIKLLPVRLPPHRGELNDDVQRRADESAGGPVQAVRDGLAFGLSRWGELTGQTQGWSLFAPTFGHQASLPVVRFGEVAISSSFKPADPNAFFRAPWPSCRLYNYEYRLALLYWRWDEESYYGPQREEWRQAIFQRVRWQQRSMQAYLRWRMDTYLREHPQTPVPTIIELYAEQIPSPPPGSSERPAPRMFPIARWSPETPSPSGHLPLQTWTWQTGWVWIPEED